jgi:MFS family permease
MSIYYLSLPDTTAQQIGRYTAMGYIFSLIFQIPAGMIGDKFGNKIPLVISKICLLCSSLMLVIGDNFRYFLVASVMISLGQGVFSTGKISAFLHDTLGEMRKENDFVKVSSRMRGRISLISVFFIIGLPFFTSISLVFPFIIGLGIDIIGLIVAFSLFPVGGSKKKKEPISIAEVKQTLKESKGSLLFPVILFGSIISAFLLIDGSFRSPYLEELGYPIARIGMVMGISRLVRFIVSRYAHKIEQRIPFKKLIVAEIFLFTFYYISASFLTNPYLIGIVFSLTVGYLHGRSDIYTDHIINLIPGKKHKSTILSIRNRITSVIQISMILVAGYVMDISFSLGFLVL